VPTHPLPAGERPSERLGGEVLGELGVADEAAGEALAARIASATERFLGHQPEFAGTVADHPALHESARLAGSVLTHAPDSPPAEAFRRIADAFDGWRTAFHDTPLEG
jgi:MinD-like ATPase involved in chromosome partitioning or flagellar assembly